MTRFDGKTAVITGASSGIGESCARKFVAPGPVETSFILDESVIESVPLFERKGEREKRKYLARHSR